MSHVKKITTYLEKLEQLQCSITPIRESILEVLIASSQPICSKEILAQLKKKGVSAHRATVYRDIDFFLKQGIVNSYSFKEQSTLYYELVSDHHHHCVCEICGKIFSVVPTSIEKAIDLYTQELFDKKKFKVSSHRLKFYGRCKACFHQLERKGSV